MRPKNIVLTRKDFPVFSSQTLSNLHGSDTFSDITLVSADGQLVSAHKIVLSSCSSVMNKLVLPTEPVLVMEASYDELILILKFIYTGKCEVEQKNLLTFLATARKLQIKGLITDGEDDTVKEEEKAFKDYKTTKTKTEVESIDIKFKTTFEESHVATDAQMPTDKNNAKQIGKMEEAENEDVVSLVQKPTQDLVDINEEANTTDIASHEENCTLCSFRIPSTMSLKSHMQEKHNYMYCNLCNEEFSGYSVLREHSLKEHTSSTHSINQPIDFEYKSSTTKNIEHFTEKVFCYFCDFVTTQKHKSQHKKSLQRHIRVRHNIVPRKKRTVGRNENFSCTVCSFSSNTHGGISRHYKHHSKDQQKEFKPYSCTLCDYSSRSIRLLKDHSITHKKTEIVYKYFCHYCLERLVRKYKRSNYGLQYKTASKLEKHITVQNERLDCADCDKKSMNFKEYRSHIKEEHVGKLKYKCDQCDFMTSISFILDRHRSNLHQGTGYRCIIEGCDYSCKVAYSREDTIRTCGIEDCQYSSVREMDMRTHKNNVHLKIRHICEDCGYSASTKSNLGQHKKSLHKDQYPEKCNQCGKCFINPSALMTHRENRHF